MTYQSGSAIAYYILDISDAERKAAQLRSIYQGIRQDAASLSTPVTANTGSGSASAAQAKGLQDAAKAATVYSSATQQLIATTIELGAAQGLTNDQINAQLAAMSRAALAAGDYAAANELIDASLGKEAEILPINTKEHEAAAKAIEKHANEDLRLAQQQARTLIAQRDNVGALQLLTNARNNASGASAQAIASAETQIATIERTTTATGALGTGLTSLLSPVLLLTAAVGGSIAVVKSFGDALDFEGQLNEEARAFGGILGDFQKGSAIIDEATTSGKEYGLTQKEITDAFKTLAPIIRESTSSTNDQVGALERLSVINPRTPVEELKKAVEGIQSGNFRALAHDIGLSPPEVAKLKEEVKGGTDVFIALNHVLDDHGITLNVARDRMTGYEGAARRAAQASEDLQKAQANLAQNTTGFIDLETQFTVGLTRLFGGAGGLTEGLRQLDAQAAGNRAGQEAYNQAIAAGKDKTDANAIATRAAAVAASNYAYAGTTSTQVLQREADADDRYTASTYKAVTATDALTHAQYEQNKQSVQDQRAGERSGGLFDTLDETTSFYNKQHVASAQAAQDAKDLQGAELNYAKATNNTVTERKILVDQLKAANGDHAAELNIKAQIYELDHRKEKTATSKGLSGLDRSEIKLAGDLQSQLDEVNHRLEATNLTQLQRNQLLIDQKKLQEQVNDAIFKEKDLNDSIALDTIHNAQKNLAEQRELAGLQRAEKDNRFSATQQLAIHLREQEILADEQKRSNDIVKEQYELQKTIKNTGVGALPVGLTGPQGGLGASQVPPIGSALPVGAQGAIPQVPLANGKQPINITINIDKEGKATVAPFDAGVTLKLIGNAFGAAVAAGGLP
jgi:hypothetical protein